MTHPLPSELLKRGMPQKCEAGREAKGGAHRVKRTPPLDHGLAFGTSRGRIGCHKPVVGRHDDEERDGPVRDQQHRPDHPPDVPGLPSGRQPEQEAKHGKGACIAKPCL